jgi:hypothetical protein
MAQNKLTSFWTHGNAVRPEEPDKLDFIRPYGWGSYSEALHSDRTC